MLLLSYYYDYYYYYFCCHAAEMQASIQCEVSTMIQLLPVKFALESNHNTLNQFKWLSGTCRFTSFQVRSNIVVLENSLVLHLSLKIVGPECPDRFLGGGVLDQNMDFNQGDRNEKHLSVQRRAQNHCSSFAGSISRAQGGPRDRSGVAISRQELPQEQRIQQEHPPIHYAATGRAQSNNSSFSYIYLLSAARAKTN
jgi:hypothetical protein